jgi:hypothetical protein
VHDPRLNDSCAIRVLQPRNFSGVFAPRETGKSVSLGTTDRAHTCEDCVAIVWYVACTSRSAMRFRFMLICLAVAALYVLATQNPFA